MRNSRKLSPIVISLVLVAVMALVPLFTFAAFAADGDTITLKVPSETGSTSLTASKSNLPDGPAWSGYTFVGWSETKVEETTVKPGGLFEKGASYTGSATELYAVYSSGSGAANSYKLYTGAIKPGKYIIVYANGAMNPTITSSRLGYTDVTITDGVISNPDASIVWTVEASGEYWTLYNESVSKYAAGTGAKNKAKVEASVSDYSKWTVTGEGEYEFVNLKNKSNAVNCNLRRNGTYGFACYSTSTGGALSLYIEAATSYTSGSIDACTHVNTTSSTVDPTCTEDGYTVVTCDDCGAELSNEALPATGHELGEWSTIDSATCTETGSKTATCTVCGVVETDTIPATGHSYENGACTVCGEAKPNNAELSFSTADNRKVSTTTQQVWEQNGITLTYDKDSYSNNLAEYENPARFYKGTKITIQCSDMIKKIEFTCNTAAYATTLANSIGGEATASDKVVTVVLGEPATSYQISLTVGQVRIDSLTVYFASEEEASCAHENTTTTTVDATCTEAGSTTVSCNDCDYEKVTEIPATGHNYVDGYCSVCGAKAPTIADIITAEDGAHQATGVVVGVNAQSFLLSDGTGIILVYNGSSWTPDVAIGDKVSVSGSTTVYGCAKQFASGSTYTKVGTETVTQPDAITLTPEQLDAYATATSITPIYVKITGVLSISNSKYFNITIEGATIKGSYTYPLASDLEAINALDGKEIEVVGYITGTTGSGAYLNILATSFNEVVAPEPAPTDPTISEASVTIGTNLAMNYYVVLPENYEFDEMKMVFTMNNVVTEVTTYDLSENRYMFSFTRLAPQCMGDSIKAELYINGTLAATYDNFSVKAYAEKLLELNPGDAELATLVADMLNYGAAAQEYVGYKTDALVNAGYETAGSNAEPTESAMTVTESSNANFGIISAGVRFDYVNQIYVKFGIRAAGLEGEPTVVIAFNNVEQTVTLNGEGEYVVYSDAISALEFGKVYTIELKVDGEVVQTLTYSVNSYVFAKKDGNNAMAELAIALYRYGNSAVAYSEK